MRPGRLLCVAWSPTDQPTDDSRHLRWHVGKNLPESLAYQPAMLIRIEDVSTDEEMRQAKQTRLTEGKHTIPCPAWKSSTSSPVIFPLRFLVFVVVGIDRGAQSGS